jgi:hypothetical protein
MTSEITSQKRAVLITQKSWGTQRASSSVSITRCTLGLARTAAVQGWDPGSLAGPATGSFPPNSPAYPT